MAKYNKIGWKYMTPEEKKAYQRRVSWEYYHRHRVKQPDPDRGKYRTCSKCKVEKLRSENFYKNEKAKYGYSRVCKECTRAEGRATQIKIKWGLTAEEYDEIKTRPCEICGGNGKMVIDHCHDKGHIRGVLCSLCNTGLGMFEDNPVRLQRAIDYLNRPR